MKFGWGTFFGAIASRIPGREESLRNKIDKLERERDDLLKKPNTMANNERLDNVLTKLRNYRKALQNRG